MAEYQRRIISFVAYLNPNKIPAPENILTVFWPTYNNKTQLRLAFQRPDDNGTGVHTEFDTIDKTVCAFLKNNSAEFLH